MAIDEAVYVAWAKELGLSEEEAGRDADRVQLRGEYLAKLVETEQQQLDAAKAMLKEHNRLTAKPEGWLVIARRYANSEISAQPIS
jgi:hypothetical protein